MRPCERNSPTDTKVSAEGREGGAPGGRAEIPWQPMGKMVVRHLCPCSLWVSTAEQRSTCSPWRVSSQSSRMPKRCCDHVGSAGSWQNLWTHGERSPHWNRFAGRTYDTLGDPTLEQFVPQELHLEERIHRGAREECEEWKRQPHKLTTAPIPHVSFFPWGRGRKNQE